MSSNSETRSQPTPIAFVITDLDRGGAELALQHVVTRLDKDRWAPHVYCLTHRGKLADELEAAGIPVTCFELSKWSLLLVLWRLRSALQNTRPAIVQTFLYHANILGRIAARLAGIRNVVSGIRVAEKRSRFRLWLDRVTDRFVSRHVCVSEAVAKFSHEVGGLPAAKLDVVPNGVDLDRFKDAEPADLNQFGVPDGAFVVLSVGRLEEQKAPDVLLEAVSPLFPTRDRLHLLYVGAGPMETALRDRISQQQIGDRVHFAGRQRDIPGIMRGSGCLALTSRWEGMPNVVLEAMGAGLPVVATDVEGVRELATSEQEALIVPIDDSGAVRTAITRLLDGPALRSRLANSAQTVVVKQFTWSRAASEFACIYDALLS